MPFRLTQFFRLEVPKFFRVDEQAILVHPKQLAENIVARPYWSSEVDISAGGVLRPEVQESFEESGTACLGFREIIVTSNARPTVTNRRHAGCGYGNSPPRRTPYPSRCDGRAYDDYRFEALAVGQGDFQKEAIAEWCEATSVQHEKRPGPKGPQLVFCNDAEAVLFVMAWLR
ncbi:MAG TPA: hypothetical protein VF601_11250 [Beijerinckiaceae bacterium]